MLRLKDSCPIITTTTSASARRWNVANYDPIVVAWNRHDRRRRSEGGRRSSSIGSIRSDGSTKHDDRYERSMYDSSDGKSSSSLSYRVDDSITMKSFLEALGRSNTAPYGSGVTVGYDRQTGRRGLYATTNREGVISPDEVVCRIPSSWALLLNDPSPDTDDDPKIASSLSSIEQCGYYYLRLYHHHNSTTQQYIPHRHHDDMMISYYYQQILPSSIHVMSETPDLYEDDEIALLEHPILLEKIQQKKYRLQELLIVLSILNDTSYNIQQLQYAIWLISTRSFALYLHDNDDDNNNNIRIMRVLIPLLDLVNHSARQSNVRFVVLSDDDGDPSSSYFALVATRTIAQGEEILLSYRSSASSSSSLSSYEDAIIDLYMQYGFVDDDIVMLDDDNNQNSITWNDWSTSLEEDYDMLSMLQQEIRQWSDEQERNKNARNGRDDNMEMNQRYQSYIRLTNILQFRIQLKKEIF